MDTNTLKALIDAGAVKSCKLVAEGSKIHALVTNINNSTIVIHTNKGSIKTWATLDSAAKWLRLMGLGSFNVEVTKWMPNQKSMI